MVNLYINHDLAANEIKSILFNGDLVFISTTTCSEILCQYAINAIERTFLPLDPLTAQLELSVEEFIKKITPLKQEFTNSPETKVLIKNLIEELGFDSHETYFDVPRLRISPFNNYLTAGVSYAYQPHRDLWYGAHRSQINIWLPVFDVSPNNAMDFFPNYWDRPIENSSHNFDYAHWVAHERSKASQQITADTRPHPLPLSPVDGSAKLCIAGTRGDLLLFSGAHLHASVPNTTNQIRYSIDFRLVTLSDLQSNQGAPNLDSKAKGCTLLDHMRCTDFEKFPADLLTE